jgi:type I restriction enzyme S subunit
MQKEKSLVPQLRFSEFEGEWRKKKLENVCSFFSGGTPTSTKKEYYTGNIAFIGSGNIFDSSVEKYISEKAFKNSSAKIVGVGDILYALYGANSGDVAISKLYGAINQAILCIRTEEEKKFLYQVLTHKKESIVRTYLQGGQGNLSAKIVKKIKIRFPKKEEQQKIANFLTSIDNRIQTLEKKKTLLEQYKKGVMQKIFKQELRFKDDTSTTLKASDGKEFPEWEEKKFSKFIKLYRGSSPRPINRYLTKEKSGVNWIKIGDTKASRNYLLESVSEKITVAGSLKSRKVRKGELILANSMSFGKTYILNIDGCIYDGWFVLREFGDYFEKRFLIQQLNSEHMQRQYKRLSTGGVVQNISSAIVYSTKLRRPSLKEQTKIANFLSAIDRNIELVTKKIEHTKTYKKGLLQQIFL